MKTPRFARAPLAPPSVRAPPAEPAPLGRALHEVLGRQRTQAGDGNFATFADLDWMDPLLWLGLTAEALLTTD